MSAPICIKCKFWDGSKRLPWCLKAFGPYKLIFGEKVATFDSGQSCKMRRTGGLLFRGDCGPSGRHFEPRGEQS